MVRFGHFHAALRAHCATFARTSCACFTYWAPALNLSTTIARLILVLGSTAVVQLSFSIAALGTSAALLRWSLRLRLAAWLGSIALALSLFGVEANLKVPLSALWVMVGAGSLVFAVARFWQRERRFELAEFAIDAGLSYLVVGAVWAFVYRADLVLLGFTGTKALLTANHFHFAGLGACVLVGGLGRLLARSDMSWRVACVGTIGAVALVAVGITLSHKVEVAAAWTLAACVLVVAYLLMGVARQARSRWAAACLTISALSALLPAALAVHFAITGFARLDDAAFERMVYFHGLINALGFVTTGLIGVRLELALRSASGPSA